MKFSCRSYFDIGPKTEWRVRTIETTKGEEKNLAFPDGFYGTIILVGAGGWSGDSKAEDHSVDQQVIVGVPGAGGGGGVVKLDNVKIEKDGIITVKVGFGYDRYADWDPVFPDDSHTYIVGMGTAYAGGRGGDGILKDLTPGEPSQGNGGGGGGPAFEEYAHHTEESCVYLVDQGVEDGADNGSPGFGVCWFDNHAVVYGGPGGGGGPEGATSVEVGIYWNEEEEEYQYYTGGGDGTSLKNLLRQDEDGENKAEALGDLDYVSAGGTCHRGGILFSEGVCEEYPNYVDYVNVKGDRHFGVGSPGGVEYIHRKETDGVIILIYKMSIHKFLEYNEVS